MNEYGIDPMEKKAVIDGIKTIFRLIGVEIKIKILDYCKLKGKSYKSPNSSFKEYKSVAWY